MPSGYVAMRKGYSCSIIESVRFFQQISLLHFPQRDKNYMLLFWKRSINILLTFLQSCRLLIDISHKKCYATLNTGLPGTPAVERLFSLGVRFFFLPLRSNKSSDLFEMLPFATLFQVIFHTLLFDKILLLLLNIV